VGEEINNLVNMCYSVSEVTCFIQRLAIYMDLIEKIKEKKETKQ